MRSFPAALLLIGSALATAADYQVQGNIHYDRNYAETVLDILQARAPAITNRPGVVMIHGGGWVEGQKEQMVDKFCLPFIQHDFVVANVEYRLANAAYAPAAVSDVLRAAKWFHDHAADYHVDPAHILTAGFSAGGHLALMTGMLPQNDDLGPTIKISAVIDFSGISDVADQVEGPHKQPYAEAWIPEQPGRLELARRLSPITYVRKGLPPILAIHGDADPVVPYEQSARLIKALKMDRVDAELITVSGGKHALADDEMDKVWPQIFKWLKKRKIGN